jgi:hypothetical protein
MLWSSQVSAGDISSTTVGESRSMFRKRSDSVPHPDQSVIEVPSALDVTSEYVAALAARDSARMNALRSQGFVRL